MARPSCGAETSDAADIQAALLNPRYHAPALECGILDTSPTQIEAPTLRRWHLRRRYLHHASPGHSAPLKVLEMIGCVAEQYALLSTAVGGKAAVIAVPKCPTRVSQDGVVEERMVAHLVGQVRSIPDGHIYLTHSLMVARPSTRSRGPSEAGSGLMLSI